MTGRTALLILLRNTDNITDYKQYLVCWGAGHSLQYMHRNSVNSGKKQELSAQSEQCSAQQHSTEPKLNSCCFKLYIYIVTGETPFNSVVMYLKPLKDKLFTNNTGNIQLFRRHTGSKSGIQEIIPTYLYQMLTQIFSQKANLQRKIGAWVSSAFTAIIQITERKTILHAKLLVTACRSEKHRINPLHSGGIPAPIKPLYLYT